MNKAKHIATIVMPYIKRNYVMCAYSLGILLAIFPPTQIFSLLIALSLLPLTFPRTVGNVYLDKFVIGLVLFFTLNTAIGAVFWILNIEISKQILFVIYYTVLAAILFYTKTRINTATRSQRKPHWKELFFNYTPLIVASVAFLTLITPLLFKESTNYIYQFIGYGGDNVSHIELVNITEKYNGYHYGTTAQVGNDFTASHSSYPQGMHLNISVLRDLTPLSIDYYKSIKAQLLFFVIVTSLFFALLTYIFTLTSLYLVRGMKTRLSLPITYAITYSLFAGVLLDFYLNGFHPHIFSLVFLLTQFLITTWIIKNSESITQRSIALTLVVMLNIGISFSWLFLLPISLLISAALILYYDLPRLLIAYRKKRSLIPVLKWWIIYIIIACVSLVQVYAQLSFSAKGDPINEPGFIAPVAPQLVAIFFLFSVLAFAIYRKRSIALKHNSLALLLFTAISGVFALYIYIYQLSTNGQLEYYFFKSAYTVIIFGCFAIILLLSEIASRMKLTATVLGGGTLMVLLYFFASINTSAQLSPVLAGQLQGISPSLANTFADEIVESNSNIVSIGSCNRAEDFLVTRLSGALRNKNFLSHQHVTFSQLSLKKKDAVRAVNAYYEATGDNFIIIDNDNGDYKKLFNKNIQDKIEYIELSDNSDRSQKSCPSELAE